MKNLFKKSLVGAAVAMAVSTGAWADATLTNGTIKAVINDGGTFGVYPAEPAGAPGLSMYGVEFVNIDVPSSWWSLESSAGTTTAQYNTNPMFTTTSGGGYAATTWDSPIFSFSQIATLTADNQISFVLSLKNIGSTALTNVFFGTGIDPDQGGSGVNSTNNLILNQGLLASVSASALDPYGNPASITLTNTTSSLASARAYINAGNCCSAVLPSTAFGANQAVSFSTAADDSISLAFDIGTIAAGQVVTLGWNYTLQAVPEPETYAMLMAGLGLMGVVARRRKQQSGAV